MADMANPDIFKNHCTCEECGTCLDFGGDPEDKCPDCPVHGYSDLAKSRRKEILGI